MRHHAICANGASCCIARGVRFFTFSGSDIFSFCFNDVLINYQVISLLSVALLLVLFEFFVNFAWHAVVVSIDGMYLMEIFPAHERLSEMGLREV